MVRVINANGTLNNSSIGGGGAGGSWTTHYVQNNQWVYPSGGGITLYAQWTTNTRIITFANGGGTGTNPNNITHTFGSNITLPANPYTRTGHTFTGWRVTSITGGVAHTNTLLQPGARTWDNFSTDTAHDRTVTVTAEWSLNNYAVAIPNSGTGFTVARIGSGDISHGGNYQFSVTLNSSHSQRTPVVSAVSGAPFSQVVQVGARSGNTYTFEVRGVTSQVNAGHFTINIMESNQYSVAVPVSRAGFQVSNPSVATVNYGGSFTFTITLAQSHSQRTPSVSLSSANISQTGHNEATRTFTYTVSGITAQITPEHFTIADMVANQYNVFTNISGEGFEIKRDCIDCGDITHGESFEFILSLDSTFSGSAPTLALLRNGSLEYLGTEELVSRYRINNVTGNIPSEYIDINGVAINNHNVVAPASDTGFYTENVSANSVIHGQGFTFELRLAQSHSNSVPSVVLADGKGSVELIETNELVRTYKVTNVSGEITENDWTVSNVYINRFDIAAPRSGIGFTVSELSQTTIDKGDGFTFTITLGENHSQSFDYVTVNLASANAVLTVTERDASARIITVKVSDVIGQVSESDFAISGVSINTFAFTFDSRGGSSVQGRNISVGSQIAQPANPTLAGNIFRGWFTDNDVWKNQWDFASMEMPNNAVTVFARWEIDKLALGTVLGNAKAIIVNKEFYTEQSIGNLKTAIESAESVYNNPNATVSNISGAVGGLTDILGQLQFDTAVIENLLSERYFPAMFTTNSLNAFVTARDNAQDYLDRGILSISGLVTHRNTLQGAITGLEKRFDFAPDIFDEIDDLVSSGDELSQTDFSAKTWNAYNDAHNNLVALLANPNADPYEVRNAIAKLASARDALQPFQQNNKTNLTPLYIGIGVGLGLLLLTGLVLGIQKRKKPQTKA